MQRAKFGDAPRGSRRNPAAPAARTHVLAGNLQYRRRLSVPRTCCHARGGPACSPSAGNPTQPNRESNEPKLALSALRLHRATSARTPMPTDTLQTADWTQPITHKASKAVMLPPPSCQQWRKRHWECAELQHTPDARASELPRSPLRRGLHRPPSPASRTWRSRAALDQRSPDAAESPHHRCDAAAGHDDVATAMGLPPGPDSRDA